MDEDEELCERCGNNPVTHTKTVHDIGGEPDEILWYNVDLCDECDPDRGEW